MKLEMEAIYGTKQPRARWQSVKNTQYRPQTFDFEQALKGLLETELPLKEQKGKQAAKRRERNTSKKMDITPDTSPSG